MLKKIKSVIMLIAILCSATVFAEPSEWAGADVETAILNGYVSEELQKDYQAPITRAEFAELAVRFTAYTLGYTVDEFITVYSDAAEGLSPSGEVVIYDGTEDFSFTDTDNKYVAAARRTGMVLGNGDGTFEPESSITREQAAVMLFRTYWCYGLNSGLWYNVELFEDRDEISDWAYYGVSFALGYDVMQGVSETRFAPKEIYTREQAIVTFARMGEIDTWKNFNDKAVLKQNPAIRTKDYVIEELLSKDWITLVSRTDTEYGTVLHTATSGIPHSPSYLLTFVDNNGETHGFSKDVPPYSGWGSLPKHENIQLSEDGIKLTFEVSFAERAVAQFGSEKVLHEAGTYYFEADLITGASGLKEFVAAK